MTITWKRLRTNLSNFTKVTTGYYLETYPITDIRQYRQQRDHLPSFGRSVEVEHERVEVVRSVAKADVHVMLHLTGLEREHAAEVEAEYCSHMVVVHAREVICSPFCSRNMHRIILRSAVLPVAALQADRSTEGLPLRYDVQYMSPVEPCVELTTLIYIREAISVGL